ncbi:MAG TPA: hypothetical protein VGV07_02770 [Devosia sp.]|jgi:hypothetical protein|uniref:hypothetical protein n=1 Tax=Devosia sp. TaxID=1871048 RepID=UPI002DDD64BF|nr:hypothetical protein [Devosia sp.]HEV2514148.1 hypothetical protein [Devosia sp.]
MALSPDEDAFIYAALVNLAASVAEPRIAITGPINDIAIAAGIASGEPATIVRQAMNLCIADGNRLAPPAIVRLIQVVAIIEPRIPAVIARITASFATNVPPPDTFADSVLAWKAPFLERRRLRQALRALLAPLPTSPIVVVTGAEQQGKSYTAEFISHVVQAHANTIAPCVVHLGKAQGAAVGPAELARDLVAGMGGQLRLEPPKVTNLDRWYQELVSWVTDAGIHSSQFVWWIVLDGFNADELRADTKAFIGQLASRLMNGIPQRRFRLILLDFDRTSLPVTPGKITPDTTAWISAGHVSDFVTQLFAGSGAAVDPAGIAKTVLDGLGDPVTDLPTLNQRLTDLIEVAETGQ